METRPERCSGYGGLGKAAATRPFTGLRDVVVVDVETTGLDPGNDRIVEVAAARGDLSVLLRGETNPYFETFEARVNPGVPIPAAASRVHGIRDRDVKDKDSFAEVAAQLREFIGARAVIAHNKKRIASMTPEQREAYLAAKRETQRQIYARMTPEQRERRNQRSREWRKGRVKTPEQRAEHNRRNREWRARKKQRMEEGGEGTGDGGDVVTVASLQSP